MKKLIAILLALSIVFTVPCMAFAASEPNFIGPSIEITPRTLLFAVFSYVFVIPLSLILEGAVNLGIMPPEAYEDFMANSVIGLFDSIPLPPFFDEPIIVLI